MSGAASHRRPVGIFYRYSAEPMGQGVADLALARALAGARATMRIDAVPVRPVRAASGAGRRFPVTRASRLSRPLQRYLGAALYRGFSLVHRLDLRLPPAPAPEVVTVYDLAPMRFADEGAVPRLALDSILRAGAVVTCSRFIAAEIRGWSGREDVEVVPLGTDEAFLAGSDAPTKELRERLRLTDRWVLHAGGVTRRKNLGLLARAWPEVRSRHPDVTLVLCGPDDRRRAELFRGLDGIRLVGRVPRADFVSLMAGASAVVVPSLYEGYGLPVQEAMALGVPVVAVDAASVPEVAGAATILVANDPAALAAGVLQALAGLPRDLLDQDRETARTRTWGATAERYVEIYQRLLFTPFTAAVGQFDLVGGSRDA